MSEEGYIVRRGDSLASVASRHGVSLPAAMAANPQLATRKPPYGVNPGDSIRIPKRPPKNAAKKLDACEKCKVALDPNHHGRINITLSIAVNPEVSFTPPTPPAEDPLNLTTRQLMGQGMPINRAERRAYERSGEAARDARRQQVGSTRVLGPNLLGVFQDHVRMANDIEILGMERRVGRQIERDYQTLRPGETLNGWTCTTRNGGRNGYVSSMEWVRDGSGSGSVMTTPDTSCRRIEPLRRPTEDELAGVCSIPR